MQNFEVRFEKYNVLQLVCMSNKIFIKVKCNNNNNNNNNNEKGTCILIAVAISGDRNMIKKKPRRF